MVQHCKNRTAIRSNSGFELNYSLTCPLFLYTPDGIDGQYITAERRYPPKGRTKSGCVDARDAGADGAEQVGGDGAYAAGDAVGGEQVAVAVGTVDGGDVADRDIRDVSHVRHGH